MRAFLLIFLAMSSGCSVALWQQRVTTHRFERAGLVESTVTLGDDTLEVRVGGEGPPLLLIHGFGGDGVWGWHPQVKDLAEDHQLIVPDLIWFGGSTSTRPTTGIEDQARAMIALLDHLGVDQVDVAGISYGGFVTLAMTALAPERVRRVAFVDSPGFVYRDEDMATIRDAMGVDDVADLVVPRDPSGVKRLIDLAYYRPPPLPGFVQKDVYEHMFVQHTDEKRGLITELVDQGPTLRDRSWSIPQPTLVVWGAEDPLFPAELGARLAAAIGPNARLVVLPRTRHAPNLERPGPFNEALEDFFGAPESSSNSEH